MATMTRAHFQIIAEAIRNTKKAVNATTVPYDVDSALALLTLVMGDALAKTNPNFSYSKFIDWCDGEVKA